MVREVQPHPDFLEILQGHSVHWFLVDLQDQPDLDLLLNLMILDYQAVHFVQESPPNQLVQAHPQGRQILMALYLQMHLGFLVHQGSQLVLIVLMDQPNQVVLEVPEIQLGQENQMLLAVPGDPVAQ